MRKCLKLKIEANPFGQPESSSCHARAGWHPTFSAEHFWILSCAGMTSFEKQLTDP